MLPPEETSQKSLDGGGPPIRVVGLSVNPKKPLVLSVFNLYVVLKFVLNIVKLLYSGKNCVFTMQHYFLVFSF